MENDFDRYGDDDANLFDRTNSNESEEIFGNDDFYDDELLENQVEDADDESLLFDEDETSMPEIEDYIEDVNFSLFKGQEFKRNLKWMHNDMDRKKKTRLEKVIVKDGRKVVVEGGKQQLRRNIFASSQKPQFKKSTPITDVNGNPYPKMRADEQRIGVREGGTYDIDSPKAKKLAKVTVPEDRKVIVEGVNDFILSKDDDVSKAKQIGYYKGKKLRELVIHMANNSELPFPLELFNPSMPLDYMYSTGLNINDKLNIAGQDDISYTDVLHNIIANSVMIPNAKFVFSGDRLTEQRVQPLRFKNKNIQGKEKIKPFFLGNEIDTFQVLGDIVFFDFFDALNRPFFPDGMDVLEYTVLPLQTVTMTFYYTQNSLKRQVYPEAKRDLGLL